MEIKKLINQLLDSEIIENQELGLSMLRSDEVSDEDKEKFVDRFVEEFTKGKVNFFSEDHHNIFKAWVEIYMSIKEKNNE